MEIRATGDGGVIKDEATLCCPSLGQPGLEIQTVCGDHGYRGVFAAAPCQIIPSWSGGGRG